MTMKALLVVLTFCSITAYGQGDEAAVKEVINQFFNGMRTADGKLLKATLAPSVVFHTLIEKKDALTEVRTEDVNAFVASVSQPHKDVYD